MANNRVIKSKDGLTLGKTKADKVNQTPAVSTNEATLQISEHIAAMMYFFFGNSDMSPDDEEEFDDITLNLASVLCLSMNLNVDKVTADGLISTTIKLEDVNLFLKEMLQNN